MSRLRRTAMVLASVSLSALALASARAAPASVPMSTLKQCADINEPSKRLACYDQVAQRPPAAGAHLPKDFPTAKNSAAPAPAATAAPAPKESFGLYNAEHPAVPRVEAPMITAKVISIGISS